MLFPRYLNKPTLNFKLVWICPAEVGSLFKVINMWGKLNSTQNGTYLMANKPFKIKILLMGKGSTDHLQFFHLGVNTNLFQSECLRCPNAVQDYFLCLSFSISLSPPLSLHLSLSLSLSYTCLKQYK